MDEVVFPEVQKVPVSADSMDLFVQKFLEAHDVKPISRDSYRRRLKQFFLWMQQVGVEKPNRETILSFKRYLEGKELTPLTIGGYLTAVRSFFAWAESEKLYPNIAKSIKSPRKLRGFRRDPLTVEQVTTVLGSIDRSTLKGKRDFALLNLMVRTGPRTIEVIRANVGDIRQESGQTVLWLQGKGSDAKDAFVVLTPGALYPLMEYLSARGTTRESEPLFGSTSDGNLHQRVTTKSIRRIVKLHLRRNHLNSPRLSSHSLRYSTVTFSLLAGASIQETQQLARHRDIRTTMTYAQNIDRAQGIPEKKIEELLAK